MKQAKTALRYAKAILDIAKEKGVECEVNDNMKLISGTIAGSDDLKVALNSPTIKSSDKKKVLQALFNDKINNITERVFSILEENGRLMLLKAVADKYTEVYEEFKGIQEAIVTTAVSLTDELEKKIQDKIVSLTGNKAKINNIVDASILGGFILRIKDLEYDASISNQFKELKKEFDNSQIVIN